MIHYLLTQLAANQVTLLLYAVVIVFALAVAWIMNGIEKLLQRPVIVLSVQKPPKRKAKHARKRAR